MKIDNEFLTELRDQHKNMRAITNDFGVVIHLVENALENKRALTDKEKVQATDLINSIELKIGGIQSLTIKQ